MDTNVLWRHIYVDRRVIDVNDRFKATANMAKKAGYTMFLYKGNVYPVGNPSTADYLFDLNEVGLSSDM